MRSRLELGKAADSPSVDGSRRVIRPGVLYCLARNLCGIDRRG